MESDAALFAKPCTDVWEPTGPHSSLCEAALHMGPVKVYHTLYGAGDLKGWKHNGIRVGDTGGGLSTDGCCRVCFDSNVGTSGEISRNKLDNLYNVMGTDLTFVDADWDRMVRLHQKSERQFPAFDQPMSLQFVDSDDISELNADSQHEVVPVRGVEAMQWVDTGGRTALHWAAVTNADCMIYI